MNPANRKMNSNNYYLNPNNELSALWLDFSKAVQDDDPQHVAGIGISLAIFLVKRLNTNPQSLPAGTTVS